MNQDISELDLLFFYEDLIDAKLHLNSCNGCDRHREYQEFVNQYNKACEEVNQGKPNEQYLQ